MNNYTTECNEIKRETMNFSRKLTNGVGKVECKFINDMIYGVLKSNSSILSNISDALDESINKINTIERLSRNLNNTFDKKIEENYLKEVKKSIGDKPVFIVDDSDIIKPYGNKFESLGRVRDGSSIRKSYEKGYLVTEIVSLSKNEKQPISVFSHIHSSTEKNYKSTNEITFRGLDKAVNILEGKTATFLFDRGYDMNQLFLYMYKKKQEFIIRGTEKRKVFYKGKWFKSTTLRDSRKGKIKTKVIFQKEEKECYISYLNVNITASKKNVKLILVYGLGEVPMMLYTNRQIETKNDAIKILKLYLSRWRIEEYFRFKKQILGFENMRVRKLKAINNLNKISTYVTGLIGLLSDKVNKKLLSTKILYRSKSLKKKVLFWYYQIAKGIVEILSKATCGIKNLIKVEKRKRTKQLSIWDL